jgi:hypothetical protein
VAAGDAHDVSALARAHADHANRAGRERIERACDQVLHDEQSQVQP